MRAMRNIMIHMYDELELDIVWSTATNDIPLLQNRVKKLISLVEE